MHPGRAPAIRKVIQSCALIALNHAEPESPERHANSRGGRLRATEKRDPEYSQETCRFDMSPLTQAAAQ